MSEQHEHKDSAFFEKYFSKSTTQQERDAMRDSIPADSFEAEAMEGFESLENNAAVLAAMKEVQQQVAKKTGLKQQRKMIFPIWKSMGIAAAVAVFVVAGFAISNMLEQDTSVGKNEKTEPSFIEDDTNVATEAPSEDLNGISEEIMDTPESEIQVLEQLDKLAEKAPEEVQNESSAKDFKKLSKPEPVEIAEQESFSDMAGLVVEDDELEVSDEMIAEEPESIAAADVIEYEEVTAARKESASTVTLSKTSTETSAPAPPVSNYAIGKSNYNERNYGDAIDYFQKAVSSDEKVNESNYYMAMSFFNLNKNNKALKYYDEVLTSNSALRFNAMWYKAVILEEKGDINGAKKLLEELSNGSSGFKNQAADKLKSLN